VTFSTITDWLSARECIIMPNIGGGGGNFFWRGDILFGGGGVIANIGGGGSTPCTPHKISLCSKLPA
jgi:hypothetical protein